MSRILDILPVSAHDRIRATTYQHSLDIHFSQSLRVAPCACVCVYLCYVPPHTVYALGHMFSLRGPVAACDVLEHVVDTPEDTSCVLLVDTCRGLTCTKQGCRHLDSDALRTVESSEYLGRGPLTTATAT